MHGDGSTTLVIRKSLLAPKGESDEDWRRNNIFQSTCTIKDKVCNLIIDIVSYENVISIEAVKKLQLITESHSNPSKLIWLNRDT